MAAARIKPRKVVDRWRRVIRRHLDAGAPPSGINTGNRRRGCLKLAADELGLPVNTLYDYFRTGGQVARAYPDLAFDWSALCDAWRRARADEAVAHEQWTGREPVAEVAVEPGRRVRRFVITWAQDETPPHEGFWRNLKAFADHYSAKIIIGAGTYQMGAVYTDRRVATGSYHPEIARFVTADPVNIVDRVLVAANINTLASAARPLSGLQTYPAGRWGIFPHPRIALESVPRTIGEPVQQVMTTGAVTLRNYVDGKKASQKAAFHHVYGAVLVELDRDGAFWCRHLLAEETSGTFYDLDCKVEGGKVTRGHRAAALTAEPHFDVIDADVVRGVWGLDLDRLEPVAGECLIDLVRPIEQHWHDLLHFERRSHHNVNDAHKRAELYWSERESVEAEISMTARFAERARRPGTLTVIVDSNHHRHFRRWLLEGRPGTDPVNARYWHHCNAWLQGELAQGRKLAELDVFAHELRRLSENGLPGVEFLGHQRSHVILPEHGGGIECGHHGDRGPNGRRGSLASLAGLGRKANIGHSHAPGILDGVVQTGVCARLDLDWLDGPSSWGHAVTLTYPNAKRAIVTLDGARYRAGQ